MKVGACSEVSEGSPSLLFSPPWGCSSPGRGSTQLQSSSGLVLALAFLPLLSEVAVVTLAATYALDLPWRWAFLLASLTTPMSPLVVMWTALQLRRADLGAPTAVCSLLLVVCALDWAAGLCLFGLALKGALQTGESAAPRLSLSISV